MAETHDDIERWSGFKVWLYSLFSKNPKANEAAVVRLGLTSDDRLLDIGCGLGDALRSARRTGAAVAGIDPSPAMVERAAEAVPGATVKVGSAEDIPFPNDDFTAAIAVATLHHWADSKRGFDEIARVLAPGGRLLIVEKKVGPKGGHGLDEAGANSVAAELVQRGFQAEIGDMTVGRKAAHTIIATAKTR